MKKTLLIFIIAISACRQNVSKVQLPQLLDKNTENGGWGADVVLAITDITTIHGANIYTVRALIRQDTVGLKITMPTQIDTSGYGKDMVIESIGEQSDRFINALATLYKLKRTSSKHFVDRTTCSYVDLSLFVKQQFNAPVKDDDLRKYKLFLGDGEAEIFLNIDPARNLLYLPEKDEEYRQLIVDNLTAKK